MGILKFAKQSVALRTTLTVFVVIAVIMASMNYYESGNVQDAVSREMVRQAGRAMDGVVADIDNRVSNVETAVKTAAAFADKNTQNKTGCYELLYRLISKNNDISAVTLLYRENFFPEMGRYYAPTVVNNPVTNELEPDEIGGPENDFNYLETDSNWIYTNLLREGYWCLPYSDSISTKRAMVTYSVPLYDDNDSIYAVLCADVALDWVRDVVEEAKPYEVSRVVVISRDSQFVCHPDPAWIQTVNVIHQAQQIQDTSYLSMVHRMLTWQSGMDTLAKDFTAFSSNQKHDNNESTLVFYAPIPRVQWCVSFTLPEAFIQQEPQAIRRAMTLTLILVLIITSFSLFFAVSRQLKPLKNLDTAARDIANGNFNKELPKISTHDEIRNLRDSFEDMRTSLSRYIEELKVTTASKASIESELKVASDIQMSMLPKLFPPYPDRNDIDIFGQLKPAKAVGGDLYDFYIRDEKLFFCIGDVSGKGVPASLVMAVTRSLFRTISAHESMPDRIMTSINDTLADGNDSNMFVTLFVGVLDLPSGKLRYCNAGHDAPLLIGSTMEFLPVESNIPTGVMRGWKFNTEEISIQPGTNIFLYTDGLTEAENINHEQFGEERIKAVAETYTNNDSTPEKIIINMTEAVKDFVGEAEQSDDLTMLIVKYNKQQLETRFRHDITIINDVQEVPRLAEFVEGACEAVGFDMGTTMQMNLAIEEAVVNVINYAYPPGKQGDIHIEAQANDVRMKFTISDSGRPFDPTAKEDVDITLSAEDRPIGGLGIHLVRQLMDSINYEYINGQNVLTLRKKLK